MMAVKAPVSELPTAVPSPKDVWAIYPYTLDWQILVNQLVMTKGRRPDGSVDPKVAVVGWKTDPNQPQIPIYYLYREFFPAEKLAAFLGKEPSDLEGIEAIHLREFKGPDGKVIDLTKWEKPSVEYWGFA